jgi:dihydrofolate reductase
VDAPNSCRRIIFIVAHACGGVIGLNGKLPWRLPEDLSWFKKNTLGRPVVMGRTTFDGLGRILPGRRIIVLTSRPETLPDGVEGAATPDEILRLTADHEALMVAGGASVYRAFMPVATDALITEICLETAGDVFWPGLDSRGWRETETTEWRLSSTGLRYRFRTFTCTVCSFYG